MEKEGKEGVHNHLSQAKTNEKQRKTNIFFQRRFRLTSRIQFNNVICIHL